MLTKGWGQDHQFILGTFIYIIISIKVDSYVVKLLHLSILWIRFFIIRIITINQSLPQLVYSSFTLNYSFFFVKMSSNGKFCDLIQWEKSENFWSFNPVNTSDSTGPKNSTEEPVNLLLKPLLFRIKLNRKSRYCPAIFKKCILNSNLLKIINKLIY